MFTIFLDSLFFKHCSNTTVPAANMTRHAENIDVYCSFGRYFSLITTFEIMAMTPDIALSVATALYTILLFTNPSKTK